MKQLSLRMTRSPVPEDRVLYNTMNNFYILLPHTLVLKRPSRDTRVTDFTLPTTNTKEGTRQNTRQPPPCPPQNLPIRCTYFLPDGVDYGLFLLYTLILLLKTTARAQLGKRVSKGTEWATGDIRERGEEERRASERRVYDNTG